MTEQRCITRNIIKNQSVNEPIWYSVDPIQATGDVLVYQQCDIATIVGTEVRNRNVCSHAGMVIHCSFAAVHLLVPYWLTVS